MIELPKPQPPQVVAQPFNDVQLVAFIAAHKPHTDPKRSVAWAIELITEAVVQAGGHKLGDAIKARKEEREAEALEAVEVG